MTAAAVPLLSSKEPGGGAPQKRQAPMFDKLASVYRWMEYLSFGPALARCRTEFLAHLMQCRNALVIGDGDGRFTARLLETNPAIQVDAIDASPAMLQALVRRAGKSVARVRTEVADARAWLSTSAEPYDLVVTHFFLDCLTTEEVRSLAERIRFASAPNTLWVVSEFAVPRTLFGRMIARPLVSALYRAFGLLTGLEIRALPDHARSLAESGFSVAARRARLRGLLVSELWTNSEARK
jgi:ubiquinone/menaquinone biosynthesis C-methylase UbiE